MFDRSILDYICRVDVLLNVLGVTVLELGYKSRVYFMPVSQTWYPFDVVSGPVLVSKASRTETYPHGEIE